MNEIQDIAGPAPTVGMVEQLQAIGWVDRTALVVLLAFFVLGLFKGLIWQVSRIGILVAAYVVSGRYGHDVARWLSSTPPAAVEAVPAQGAPVEAMADSTVMAGDIYQAYVLVFIGVLIVLSLLAMLIKKLIDKAGLSFYDRLGGGFLGVATGACVVLAFVFVINMFFPGSQLAQASQSSHSLRWSQRAINWLGTAVNDDLRIVLSLSPLDPRAPGGPNPGGPDGASSGKNGGGSAGVPGGVSTLPEALRDMPGGEQPPGTGKPTIPGTTIPGTTAPGTTAPGTTAPPAQGPGGGIQRGAGTGSGNRNGGIR